MKKTTCKKRRLQKPEPLPNSHSNGARRKSIKTVNGFNSSTSDLYPAHSSPTTDECLSVRDDLLNLHGFPREFVKYREERARLTECGGGEHRENVESEVVDEKESVLDGLVKTVLSQNTTEVNSERAFVSLKSAFGTWENVSLLVYLNDLQLQCLLLDFGCFFRLDENVGDGVDYTVDFPFAMDN